MITVYVVVVDGEFGYVQGVYQKEQDAQDAAEEHGGRIEQSEYHN